MWCTMKSDLHGVNLRILRVQPFRSVVFHHPSKLMKNHGFQRNRAEYTNPLGGMSRAKTTIFAGGAISQH